MKKVCRVCGERLYKAKGRQGSCLAKNHMMQELAEVFRVDASKDHQDTHPPHSVDPAEPAKPSWSPSIPEEGYTSCG